LIERGESAAEKVGELERVKEVTKGMKKRDVKAE
jgi:hypothetical protein